MSIVIKPVVFVASIRAMPYSSALMSHSAADALRGRMIKIVCHCSLKQNFQLNQRLLKMMRYIKMFLTHVQMALHRSFYHKIPISMFLLWFSERVEK